MLRFFLRIRSDFTENHIPVYAGNASFFLLLSVFPLATLILGLTPWLPIGTEELLELIGRILPESARTVFRYIFDMNDPTAVVSISAVAALWSASRGTYGLLRGLNKAYELKENRGYFRLRLHCFFETFLLLLAIAAVLLLYVFGQPIARWLESSPLRIVFGSAFRFLAATTVLIFLFALLYLLLPNHRVSFRSGLPGAAFSGAGWMAFSSLYSLYVNHFSGTGRLYGSLSAIAVTMLWLYICMEIFFLGGILNHNLACDA